MNDQLRINDRGEIEAQPLTWDGEPLYCPDTVREGLFPTEAFKQMRGQTTIHLEPFCKTCGKPVRGSFRPCCADAADVLAAEENANV